MTIKEVLNKNINLLKENNIKESTIKAKILLAFILNVGKEYLSFHWEKHLPEELQVKYEKSIDKLVSGYPIQYITNSREFMKLKFYVDENVLIPRQDTEVLVEEVMANICAQKDILEIKYKAKKDILDMCTGSGAIAVSLAKYIENANVLGTDISEKAIEIAKKNAKENNVEVEFRQSNMFEDIDQNLKFDIIVSNPPYIETETISLLDEEVKKEPKIALDGGQDGLEFYRIIANNSKQFLKKDGYLALEIGYNQKETVTRILIDNGYKNIECKKDLSGNDRIIVCKKET